MIKTLVGVGIDANAPRSSEWTPLHLTNEIGRSEVVEKLVALGTDAKGLVNDQWTPPYLAVYKEHWEVVKNLSPRGPM